MGNTVVILGAGSSAEAGIPTAVRMTNALIEDTRKDPMRAHDVTSVLRYVLGGLQFHQGKQGQDTSLVDIESLLEGLSLLERRRASEVSAFVKWDDYIEKLNRSFGSRDSQVFREIEDLLKDTMGMAAGVHGAQMPNTWKLQQAVRNLDNESWQGYAFTAAKAQLLERLVHVTWRRGAEEVDYLQPLLFEKSVTAVATLNYDNTIERAAHRAGVGVHTGITQWLNGITDFVPANPSDRPILKLHGSSNWLWRRHPNEHEFDEVADPFAKECKRRLPVVLFGGQVKLTAKGPFLDLLMAFRNRLQQAKRLIVVGYSFRDEHVNEYIGRWKRAGNTDMHVVDPTRIDHELLKNCSWYQCSASAGIQKLFA